MCLWLCVCLMPIVSVWLCQIVSLSVDVGVFVAVFLCLTPIIDSYPTLWQNNFGQADPLSIELNNVLDLTWASLPVNKNLELQLVTPASVAFLNISPVRLADVAPVDSKYWRFFLSLLPGLTCSPGTSLTLLPHIAHCNLQTWANQACDAYISRLAHCQPPTPLATCLSRLKNMVLRVDLHACS